MSFKPIAADPECRPGLCHTDTMDGNAGLIHMGRKIVHCEISACGAPVWCFGTAFNPEDRMCEACIEAAGFDPRPTRLALREKQGALI